MAIGPQVDLGTLNRIRASVQVANIPDLNITSPYLGREGISATLDGAATTTLPQMIGTVQSPEPYQLVTVTAHLIKTQALVLAWKSQMESDTRIGNIVVRSDATGLTYNFNNCAILGVDTIDMSGRDAGWALRITGAYVLNANLYNF